MLFKAFIKNPIRAPLIGDIYPSHLEKMNFPIYQKLWRAFYGFRQFFALLILPELHVNNMYEFDLKKEYYSQQKMYKKEILGYQRKITKLQKQIKVLVRNDLPYKGITH